MGTSSPKYKKQRKYSVFGIKGYMCYAVNTNLIKECGVLLKWFALTQNQYIGFFGIGLALFVLQQMPYIIMPLLHLESNPLMEMQDKSAVLNAIEKILGVSCVILMIFLVRGDVQWFSLNTIQEKIFFGVAMLAIIVYFVGWVFYFRGFHDLTFMLITLVAMPPIYYAFIGLWRGNYVLAVVGGLFLIAHLSNVWNNMK